MKEIFSYEAAIPAKSLAIENAPLNLSEFFFHSRLIMSLFSLIFASPFSFLMTSFQLKKSNFLGKRDIGTQVFRLFSNPWKTKKPK